MLGAFAVGKTSLVQRYVNGIFSEKYITTLGVKIDKKTLDVDDKSISLILWDLAGEDEFMRVRSAYLRGTSAAILVADGTREESLDIVLELNKKIQFEVGDIPTLLLVNKSDLKAQWNIDRDRLDELARNNWIIIETSAKESTNVGEAFSTLAQNLVAGN